MNKITEQEVKELRGQLAFIIAKMVGIRDLFDTKFNPDHDMDRLQRDELIALIEFYSGIIDMAKTLLEA